MARTTSPPLVDHTHLLLPDHADETVAVGSPAWYAWLENATSFVFRSPRGTFTAAKEHRSPAQEYWKAYRRGAGRLQRAYLGKSGELTLDRLNAAAAELAHKLTADVPASGAAIPDTPPLSDTAAAPDNAQSLHLLSTKLAIPTFRATLVPRPRLAAQIDRAIAQQHKLILIAAPAGFGKTTMIAAWLAELRIENEALRKPVRGSDSQRSMLNAQIRVAWLALDDSDNQLSQFLAYLIAALETARPQLGTAAWALLRAHVAQPPAHAILTSLVNALAAPADPLVLVLDDYHTITLQAIHEAITFLLDRMPAHMQIVITTRADPPLPLARLRARGQLTELRAADLRFTNGEAAFLFGHIHGITLAPEAVAALEARTEGWATGLQLAALSLRQRAATELPAFLAAFAGSHAYVFDYLAEEVFRQQPAHVRVFLVQTSILGRMCGPLCAAVTGQNDAQTLLEDLDQANLFIIQLDSSRRWYRYHHLFRDFLCEYLERAGDADGHALLHRRASAWFEQQGLVGEATDHALQATAWDVALRCMTPLMDSQRFYTYYLDWPRWLAALPDAALSAELDLCRRLAWILIFTGQLAAADRPLSLAETAWRAAGNQAKVGELLGLRAITWGWKGDFARAIQAAQQALALLPADAVDRQGVPAYVLGASDLRLGHIGTAIDWLLASSAVMQRKPVGTQHPSEAFLSLGTTASLARAYQLRGDLQHAAALYRDVIAHMGSTPYLQVPSALIFLGSLCYEWNDLVESERMLRAGLAVAERIGRDRYWPSAWAMLAQVLLAGGDAPQAQALFDHALVVARTIDNAPNIAEAEVIQGWLWLAQGDLAAALRWLHTRAWPIDLDRPLSYTQQIERLMYIRICIAQARQEPAAVDLGAMLRELNELLQLAKTDQRLADQITILALLALAHAIEGDSDQALTILTTAIRLGATEGYIRTFVNEGAHMRALLHALRGQLPPAAPDERLQAYVDRLLEAFPRAASAHPESGRTSPMLSEREQVVLEHIAAGRSIAEIAAALVISAHTARTHVKNIYTKLDAHNRVQALERARALQLL
jgi:LuxR family maltose regulon positive regulatory protein